MIRLALLLCCLSFITANQVEAQAKTSNTSKSTPKKFPVLKACIGTFCDSSSMSKEQLKAIIGATLRVTDEKNNKYRVVSYYVRYNKWAQLVNEQTGDIKRGKEDKIEMLYTTPLPAKYQNWINEGLQAGEIIEFVNILVTDTKGLNYFAPNIRYIIQ
jgi:hypothetical protein